MVSRSLVSSLCWGFCATLTPGRAQADGGPKGCCYQCSHSQHWKTPPNASRPHSPDAQFRLEYAAYNQAKSFSWSPANTRTGNSQHLRTGRAWTQHPLPTPCTQLVWNKPTEKFPCFIPLLTWAMGLSQELRLHRWQESSHLCLKQNQPTLSCRNSICISPKRDGKSLIIKPIAFSRWSKKSTFKKLPRGL